MKRLISFLLCLMLVFSGCSKEEVIRYDFVVYDNALDEIGEYLESFENESYIVEKFDIISGNINDLFTNYEEDIKNINSITVYSDNISDDNANFILSFAKKENIPVVFAVANVSEEIFAAYDKVYSVNTDYTHAAEIAAEKMTDYWKDNIIIDSDENLIFKFAVVKDEELSADMQKFHDTLIADIELYGIPMQLNETVVSDDISSAEDLENLKENNEGIIVISDDVLPFVAEYSSEDDGIEIITVTNDTDNAFSGDFTVLNCFVDYTQYKKAVDELIENFNNREYMLSNLSFPYIEKTIYIPATI